VRHGAYAALRGSRKRNFKIDSRSTPRGLFRAIEEVGCELAIVGHTTVIEPQRGPVDDRALLDHHPDMAAHL
jgi:hypothetical protein